MKKLRYTIYFFESLFDGPRNTKALSRYENCLERLQDSLGALNDIAVHHRLIAKLDTNGDERKSRMIALAAGGVVGNERCEIEPLLDASAKAARKLRRAEVFWA
jgi:triphosphatase